jgi:hypothetical protein
MCQITIERWPCDHTVLRNQTLCPDAIDDEFCSRVEKQYVCGTGPCLTIGCPTRTEAHDRKYTVDTQEVEDEMARLKGRWGRRGSERGREPESDGESERGRRREKDF